MIGPTAWLVIVSAPASAEALEALCVEAMRAGELPGLAVVVVAEEQTMFQRSFGLSDVEARTEVSPDTAFELASNSKAFTSLAMLVAAERYGVSLDARVSRFVPWIELRWQGGRADPTLEELLHHTSGVPADALLHLESTSGRGALADAIRGLMPLELAHAPGAAFEYSSVNYDVVGLVIEAVSGASFEDFLRDEVLVPAGMGATTTRWAAAPPHRLAQGYRMGFWEPRAYDPPTYAGNTPAAYITSTSSDLARWLAVQLGTAKVPPSLAALARRTHTSMPAPASPGDRSAMGWFVAEDGTVYHEGANPTFSSYVGFDVRAGVGVTVLTNVNSEHTFELGRDLLDAVRGRTISLEPAEDELVVVDSTASGLTLGLGSVAVCAAVAGARRWRRSALPRSPPGARAVLSLATYLVAVYWAPVYLGGGVPWSALVVWGPASLLPATVAAVGAGVCGFVAWALRARAPIERMGRSTRGES